MLSCFTTKKSDNTLPITVITIKQYPTWLTSQSETIKSWLAVTQFKAESGALRLIPDANGNIAKIICCVTNPENLWEVGNLPILLPEGTYEFEDFNESYAIAWGLGSYQFTRYKKAKRQPATLYLPADKMAHVTNIVESIYYVRDLINTPTDDMGPTQLAASAEALAKEFNGTFTQIVGEDLLAQNYPAIHAVGRASDEAPRLLDIRWGNKAHPKVTLVGKGVCFDTGGLDIKPSAYMLLMKKDMGGSAHALGLARMIMQAKLPIQLRVLIPAVENAISGNAYRPGDVITSRKGLTIEVGNTDAEGRVVLADALTEAVSENPELLIDLATLTGAARVAVGTEIAAVFSNEDDVVNALIKQGEKMYDPMWRLPLHAAYRELINSPIADLNNNSSEPYAGAITAALFLKEFVPDSIPWLHFDIMAWNTRAKPGKPQGGEAMALRALFAYLQGRYQGK